MSLKTLLKRLGWPDVIKMAETVFGTGDVLTFEDKPVIGQFTRSSSIGPGKWRNRRGFKSITRMDPRLAIRNHRPLARPQVAADLRLLDGSSKDFPLNLSHVHQKGTDARGMFDLVTLNHYTLRSLESFLVKHARGDAVAEGRADKTCFQRRNQTVSEIRKMLGHLTRLKAEIASLKRNQRLNDLHLAAVDAQKAKIAELRKTPLCAELLSVAGHAPADG